MRRARGSQSGHDGGVATQTMPPRWRSTREKEGGAGLDGRMPGGPNAVHLEGRSARTPFSSVAPMDSHPGAAWLSIILMTPSGLSAGHVTHNHNSSRYQIKTDLRARSSIANAENTTKNVFLDTARGSRFGTTTSVLRSCAIQDRVHTCFWRMWNRAKVGSWSASVDRESG